MEIQASLPSGFRDFSPQEVKERDRIVRTLIEVFELYGYQPVQTPAIEYTETLLGKYGKEGEKLLYYILDSGDFLSGVSEEARKDYRKLRKEIAHKALRYDLTVPLARYVAMNRHELSFPFKRYQIQSVWRADRPQRGRFREFVQCDIDVVGATSLIYDLECIKIYQSTFEKLDLQEIRIEINHRQLLVALAIHYGIESLFVPFCTILDKLDKVAIEELEEEFLRVGIDSDVYEGVSRLYSKIEECSTNEERIELLQSYLQESEAKKRAFEDLEFLFSHFLAIGIRAEMVKFNPFLARGLDYYTGTIYEVKEDVISIGSLGGGGRYDRLLETFGIPSIPCVGISFGLDRIHYVLKELGRLELQVYSPCQVLIVQFQERDLPVYLQIRESFIQRGISADIFPETRKMKKQLQYANKLKIPFVLFAGEDEIRRGQYSCKNMRTGKQIQGTLEEIIAFIQSDL